MSAKIDKLLDFLAVNDTSHDMDEIANLLIIPYDLCEKISRFLAKFGFIEINDSGVKINHKAKDFIMTTLDEAATHMPRPVIQEALQR